MAVLDTVKSGLKALFGKDSTAADRKRNVSLDLITSDLENIPTGALAALWEVYDTRNPYTPRMIREARKAMNGELRSAMAPEWDDQDRADFEVSGPDAYMRPRDTAARLASKKARTKRPLTSLGPKAQTDSTRIEQFDNAVLDEQFADYETVEMNLNESQSLWICLPAPAAWKTIPTLYDEMEEEGEFLPDDEYDAMPESKQTEYEAATSDKSAYKRIRSRYRTNSKGEKDSGSADFEIDLKATTKQFTAEMEDAYARNCPIILRGPISRLDFVPIDPTFSGRSTNVEGVIIRTLYRRSKLKREYAFESSGELLEPVDRYDGRDGDFYLYELWAKDQHDRPFVAYQVGKNSTRFSNNDSTAVIRLWEEYPGITELPISFEYGQHTADPNADKRGLAFPIPYIKNWAQRDAILTALCISIAQSGYPTWFQKITEESLRVMEQLPGDVDLEFRMRPNTVQYVVGDIVEGTSRGTNADVKIAFQALDALNDKELASKAAFGGEGATSGLDRQVLGKDMEVSFGGTITGYRRQKEAMGRYALMVGSALGKKAGRPVEVYAIGTAPNPQTGGTVTTRTRLTLPPDICGDNWDVVAEFETVPGERLAQSSLFLEALSQGAILLREWREWGVGDQNPEQFMWEKMLEDFYLKDPAGRLQVYTGMLDYVADTKTKQMLLLAHQGEVTSSTGGIATSLMGSMLGTGQPANTGMGGGPANPGQQALASGNGAAMRASAAAAGSPLEGAPAQAA